MKKKILLVEDDLAIIDVYNIAFTAAGFEVEIISDGQLVMDKIKNIELGKDKASDIILLDMVIPNFNGMDILKEIKKGKKTKSIKLFILSNNTDAELKKMGYDLGNQKCLTKSQYTPTQLVEILKKELK
jgi:DNA-binding response OmpR family regulator